MKLGIDQWPGPAYWGGWALASCYSVARGILNTPLSVLLAFTIAHFGLWAMMGLVAMPVMRRHPLRMHWRSWLFHLLFGSMLAVTDLVLGHFSTNFVTGVFKGSSAWEIVIMALKYCFHLALLTYFGFLALVQGFDTLHLARERERQVAEHKVLSAQAQLKSLKLQLQPHFLFNTLHAIGSMMHYDVPTSERMLNRLSDLLRSSLRETDRPLVSLKEEIALIQAYVEIETIRFEQRLSVSWEIPVELHGLAIPPFILQPLIENAVKYCVAPRADGGRIVIRAACQDAQLILEVEDDGPDGTPHQKGFGIGLANTRLRLQAMYGERQRVELLRANSGTVARLTIPLDMPVLVAA